MQGEVKHADEKTTRFQDCARWATRILLEAGAIHECDQHGWAKDRADPIAGKRRCGSRGQPVARIVFGGGGRRGPRGSGCR
jgi:hypothetical protein